MKVILISGKAQSGKDTAASLMRKKLESDNHRVLIAHYADLLKFICRNYFGWDGIKDEKGRRVLQYVGTDVIRKDNPSLWVDFAAQMLKYSNGNWDYVIIPDCRFPNELSGMIQHGFDTVYLRIVRDNFDSPLTEEQQKHSSETALDDYKPDYCIHNNGTLEDLEKMINKWIKEILYEHKL